MRVVAFLPRASLTQRARSKLPTYLHKEMPLYSIVLVLFTLSPRPSTTLHCEAIRIPMCRGLPYNMTRLPNLLHHSTQENAILAVEQFEVLRWTRCSNSLSFFLCTMYAPICTAEFQTEAIPPCKSVCEKVRRGCEPLLNRFNISWPHTLDCSRLPRYDKGVCITPEAIINEGRIPETQTTATVSRKARGKDMCRCGRSPRLQRNLYLSRRYEYVIRGHVRVSETFGELTLTTVLVREVLKYGWVVMKPNSEVRLWTNSTCACPQITPGKEYLILGHEDETNQRLLYVRSSLAVPYKQRYIKRLQKWERRLQKSLRKKKNAASKRENGKKKKGKTNHGSLNSNASTILKIRKTGKLGYKSDKERAIKNKRWKRKGGRTRKDGSKIKGIFKGRRIKKKLKVI